MKRRVTVYAWLLWFTLFTLWACGIVLGFTLGQARADQCSGWSGQFFNYSNCGGYVCQGVSFGPFWTNNCNYVAPPLPLP